MFVSSDNYYNLNTTNNVTQEITKQSHVLSEVCPENIQCCISQEADDATWQQTNNKSINTFLLGHSVSSEMALSELAVT